MTFIRQWCSLAQQKQSDKQQCTCR